MSAGGIGIGIGGGVGASAGGRVGAGVGGGGGLPQLHNAMAVKTNTAKQFHFTADPSVASSLAVHILSEVMI